MFWLGSGHCNFFVVGILYTKLKSKRRGHSFELVEWYQKMPVCCGILSMVFAPKIPLFVEGHDD